MLSDLLSHRPTCTLLPVLSLSSLMPGMPTFPPREPIMHRLALVCVGPSRCHQPLASLTTILPAAFYFPMDLCICPCPRIVLACDCIPCVPISVVLVPLPPTHIIPTYPTYPNPTCPFDMQDPHQPPPPSTPGHAPQSQHGCLQKGLAAGALLCPLCRPPDRSILV